MLLPSRGFHRNPRQPAASLRQERRLFARISRVRKRQRQAACLHARLAMAVYDEQREREMRSISSLLMQWAESESDRGNARIRMSPRFRNPAHAYIDFRNLIPGRIVYDPRLRQIKDSLEGTHGVCSVLSVDAIRGNPGDCRVVLGNAV